MNFKISTNLKVDIQIIFSHQNINKFQTKVLPCQEIQVHEIRISVENSYKSNTNKDCELIIVNSPSTKE